MTLEPHLFHNPDEVEAEMLGTGLQRRGRVGCGLQKNLKGP